MNYKILDKNSKEEVTSLFMSVFSSSEGEKEGELIGNLASKLTSRADNQEIVCIGAYEEKSIIGTIFFTRLRFNEPITVYMFAPLAVSTQHQGKGVGQALVKYGLNELKKRSVAVAGGPQERSASLRAPEPKRYNFNENLRAQWKTSPLERSTRALKTEKNYIFSF
jgi:predicted N-acetyltransferase YhbS